MRARFLSVSDVALVLGISPDFVRVLCRRGRLPSERTAGGWRLFDRELIEQLAKERTEAARRGDRGFWKEQVTRKGTRKAAVP